MRAWKALPLGKLVLRSSAYIPWARIAGQTPAERCSLRAVAGVTLLSIQIDADAVAIRVSREGGVGTPSPTFLVTKNAAIQEGLDDDSPF